MDMTMDFKRKLPTPLEVKKEFPVTPEIAKAKDERDKELQAIFEGKEDKFILVIGPCSADREDAVLDYEPHGQGRRQSQRQNLHRPARLY